MTLPLNLFISYTHKDEDLKDELAIHLASLKREGAINPWQDRDIEAGAEWDDEIRTALESAQIILLLITPRFIASRYCFDEETKRAMERHEAGTARVIPIIMKPSDWTTSPFSKLQVLPKEGKPVTRWDDQDEALVNVVSGLRRVVKSLANKPSSSGTQAETAPTAHDAGGASSSPTVSAASSSSPESPLQKRRKLNKLLSGIPGPQFSSVVTVIRPPAGVVPPASAPQSERVAALMDWAESPKGCGLDDLEAVTDEVIS
ncbi:MAG: toll/interleukin-1 receptor domain-containing protein [Elainellaceae cyanobacterium]